MTRSPGGPGIVITSRLVCGEIKDAACTIAVTATISTIAAIPRPSRLRRLQAGNIIAIAEMSDITYPRPGPHMSTPTWRQFQRCALLTASCHPPCPLGSRSIGCTITVKGTGSQPPQPGFRSSPCAFSLSVLTLNLRDDGSADPVAPHTYASAAQGGGPHSSRVDSRNGYVSLHNELSQPTALPPAGRHHVRAVSDAAQRFF